jgi:hypothetical protein
MRKLLKKGGNDILVVFVLATLSLVMTYPLVFHASDYVPSDLSDPLYNIWVMSWDIKAFGSGFAHFADANIFYPHRGTLFYADILPALALLGAPVFLLSGNPVLMYNLLFLFSFFLSGAGMYVLVKYLTSSRNAAFVAALIFTFFPYRFAHISHLELLFFGWMPLCFFFIHRFFENPTFRNILGVALFYILQVLSCAYYGAYLTLFAGLMLLYYAIRQGFWRKAGFWGYMVLLGVLCAAALLPYFGLFFKVHEKMLFLREIWEVKHFSAELQHFLAVPPFHLAWGWLTGKLGRQEWQLFPGIIPIALTLIWLIKRKSGQRLGFKSDATAQRKRAFLLWDSLNLLLLAFVIYLGISGGFEIGAGIFRMSAHKLANPVALLIVSLCFRVLIRKKARQRLLGFFRTAGTAEKFYLFILVLAWLLSFGPVIRCLGREIIAGPYNFLYHFVPGFRNVRVPSRFVVLMMLGLSVLSGWGILTVLNRWKSSRTRNGVTAGIAVIVLLEYLSVPLPLVPVPVKDRIPEIYTAVKKLPAGASLIELPMPAHDHEEYEEAPAVYHSLFHGKNIVNGYSGYSPPGYRVVREAMEQFPSEATLRLLEDLDVDYILVHTEGFRAQRGQEIIRRLNEHYSSRVTLEAKASGDYLYRLVPQEKAMTAEEVLKETGDRFGWHAQASLNKQKTGLAHDGDLNTGWSTGYPQRRDDFFELDLGSVIPIKKVELYLNNHPLDYPRSFRVEGSTDAKTWFPLYETKGFFPALEKSMVEDFRKYVVPVPLGTAAIRFLRITLTESHEARHWSINEIVFKE